MTNEDNTTEFAEIDYDREKRTGFPEVIFGETKTPEQSSKIAKRIYDNSGLFLITRTNKETYDKVIQLIPEANFDSEAKMIWLSKNKKKSNGFVCVVSAGTSDIPIAKEVEITASLMGNKTEIINDVGVTGIHRILGKVEKIKKADCVVVVA